MSRQDRSRRPGSDRASLYDDITNKIIGELEAGRFPWVQPWGTATAMAPLAMPRNAATGRHYSGINVLILRGAVIEHGFPGQSWLTFRQALSLGGNVRKGERGTTVVYADRFNPEDKKRRARETGEEAQTTPFLKRFTVFNVAQCDGLSEEIAAVVPLPPPGLIEPRVEALIRATGIDFRIGGNRAFYVPSQDFVQVPPPQAYFETINWHRTALHELGHATGHPSRLNRDFSGSFGTKKYAFEELIAEINAAFWCASLGIVPTVRHADYIGSWLEVLREDNRAIVRAASQASKAADWLLSFLPDADSPTVELPPRSTGGQHDPPDRRTPRAASRQRPPARCRSCAGRQILKSARRRCLARQRTGHRWRYARRPYRRSRSRAWSGRAPPRRCWLISSIASATGSTRS
jgi:antirestriction protein ArdC